MGSIHSCEDQDAVLAVLPHRNAKDLTAGETVIPDHDISTKPAINLHDCTIALPYMYSFGIWTVAQKLNTCTTLGL